jgi:hypothetical protein
VGRGSRVGSPPGRVGMIVVRVELWPYGDPRPLRQIALLGIVNVGPDGDGRHAYEAASKVASPASPVTAPMAPLLSWLGPSMPWPKGRSRTRRRRGWTILTPTCGRASWSRRGRQPPGPEPAPGDHEPRSRGAAARLTAPWPSRRLKGWLLSQSRGEGRGVGGDHRSRPASCSQFPSWAPYSCIRPHRHLRGANERPESGPKRCRSIAAGLRSVGF